MKKGKKSPVIYRPPSVNSSFRSPSSRSTISDDFYGEVIGQKCRLQRPSPSLCLPKSSHHVGPNYYWNNPWQQGPSLETCVKTSSNCKNCQHELSKYFQQHSLPHSKELGEDYLTDLAYLVNKSIEIQIERHKSRDYKKFLDIVSEVPQKAGGEVGKDCSLERSPSPSTNLVSPAAGPGSGVEETRPSPDSMEQRDMTAQIRPRFTPDTDSDSDMEINVPNTTNPATRHNKRTTTPESDADFSVPGASQPSESTRYVSLKDLREMVHRVPRSPSSKAFISIRDLKEVIFSLCTNKCNCIEKPLIRMIKGCTKAEQTDMLKIYHHIPLGYRVVRFRDLLANLEVIYHRVLDQHGKIQNSSPPPCVNKPDPDLIPMGDLIACFPFVETTITEMIHKISAMGLKKAVGSFGVLIEKLSPSQAAHRMLEKARSGVLPTSDKNWQYVTSNTLVVSWPSLKKHLGHWVSAPEEIVLDTKEKPGKKGGSSYGRSRARHLSRSPRSPRGRRSRPASGRHARPVRPKATPIHVTLAPEHEVAARRKQQSQQLAQKYPAACRTPRSPTRGSPGRKSPNKTPTRPNTAGIVKGASAETGKSPTPSASKRPTPTPGPGGTRHILAAKNLDPGTVPKAANSAGVLKGSTGPGQRALPYAARPKSSPSPMARLREEIKAAVLQGQASRGKHPPSSHRARAPARAAGGESSVGDTREKPGKKAASRQVESWMGKMQREEKNAQRQKPEAAGNAPGVTPVTSDGTTGVHTQGGMTPAQGKAPATAEGVGKEVSFHDMLVEQGNTLKARSNMDFYEAIKSGKHPVEVPLENIRPGPESRETDRDRRVRAVEKAVKLTYTSRTAGKGKKSRQTHPLRLSSPPCSVESEQGPDAPLRRSEPQIQYVFTREERIKRYLLQQALEQGRLVQGDAIPHPGHPTQPGDSNINNNNNARGYYGTRPSRSACRPRNAGAQVLVMKSSDATLIEYLIQKRAAAGGVRHFKM